MSRDKTPLKTCKGPCGRRLKLVEELWRKKNASRDGYRHECRACESKLSGLRRNGIKAASLQNDPGKQPIRKTIPKSKVYVVTYAQNATPAHPEFLKSLLVYCSERNAELLVIPGRYKNPTSIWNHNNRTDEWWDPKLHPYLFAGRKTLGSHLTIYGDISIQPTSDRPLTGFEVFSGECSAVFGHPRLQLKTVATAKRYYPRILTTTGAVTKTNYTDSKAGKKGEAHHVLGATVIEQGEKLFHMRQINATRDGRFIDIDREYTPEGSKKAGRALALICGDIHVEKSDLDVLKATFTSKDSIVNTLQPETIVYHDVLDFNRRNHHNIHQFRDRYSRATGVTGDNVQGEVMNAIRFLDNHTPAGTEAFVVQSNHDEAFDRWLDEADPKRDPINALFFYETWVKKLKVFDRTKEWIGAFHLLYKEYGEGKVRFLSREEPLKIGGIYCNFHGDKGLNGAKGSVQAYATLGSKTITGHSHSPSILDGAYVVGVTGKLDHEYNYTPSSWMNSHVVIYSNSKRVMIHIVEGAWK